MPFKYLNAIWLHEIATKNTCTLACYIWTINWILKNNSSNTRARTHSYTKYTRTYTSMHVHIHIHMQYTDTHIHVYTLIHEQEHKKNIHIYTQRHIRTHHIPTYTNTRTHTYTHTQHDVPECRTGDKSMTGRTARRHWTVRWPRQSRSAVRRSDDVLTFSIRIRHLCCRSHYHLPHLQPHQWHRVAGKSKPAADFCSRCCFLFLQETPETGVCQSSKRHLI